MTHINLLVGGPQALYPEAWPQMPGIWGGVDRGTLHLLQAGITPRFAVGDFDSLTAIERADVAQQVPVLHTAPAQKDETDTEMAVRLAFTQYHATQVTLVGATGGRLDHLLANLFLPTQPRFADYTNQIDLRDGQNWVRFFQAGTYTLLADRAYPYLGIVPLTAITALTIQGAKYLLQDWSSQTPFSWASNEFSDSQPVTITWQAGVVAVIYSRDRVGQKTDN
ncbi:thiamine diphosphokinase [Lacticaseibacillus baoqingensis]|uniref:Thiamine diphosphokinase n=1 Tax=Lacticaseibacillus baoqingensis TaxID=2486013 RepID=A0ABW4E730_9LACO|nr:thiamine diphosphokinase [Lacticaseibacillus baoqingensis]